MKIRKARRAMEEAIADPWAESRDSQANRAANTREFARAVGVVQNYAIELIKDEGNRVRVEDYLAVLSAATGEATIADSGCIDIEHSDLVPGQGLFTDAINRVLSGDGTSLAEAGPQTVVGILRDHLVPDLVAGDAFGSIERHYRHVAENVGASRWGSVVVTVPEAHWPSILPIESALEMRPIVNGEADRLELRSASCAGGQSAGWSRHALCAAALASAISQTAVALDPHLGVTLALEVTFGMAKMAPISTVTGDGSRPIAPSAQVTMSRG